MDVEEFDQSSDQSEKNKKKNSPKKKAAAKQKEPELLSKELQWGLWYVENKDLLKKILMGAILAVAALTWGYTIIKIIDLYVINADEDQNLKQAMLAPKIDYQNYQSANRPKDIQNLQTKVFNLGDGRYDLVAIVKNPNQQWYGKTVSYYFQYGNQKTEDEQAFILPGQEKKIITKLGFETESNIKSASLVISDVEWEKVVDFEEKREMILEIETENEEYVPFSRTGLSQEIKISKVKFTAVNKSAYDFYDVGFYVMLFRGSTLSGVSYLKTASLNSGEVRDFEVSLYNQEVNPSGIEVIADVDILNDANLKNLENLTGSGR